MAAQNGQLEGEERRLLRTDSCAPTFIKRERSLPLLCFPTTALHLKPAIPKESSGPNWHDAGLGSFNPIRDNIRPERYLNFGIPSTETFMDRVGLSTKELQDVWDQIHIVNGLTLLDPTFTGIRRDCLQGETDAEWSPIIPFSEHWITGIMICCARLVSSTLIISGPRYGSCHI
jgi:hypothetical protein